MPTDDVEARVACRICGVEPHLLGKHLRVEHGLEPAEYHRKYPAAAVASDWVSWGISRAPRLDAQGLPYWTRDRVTSALKADAKRRGRSWSSTDWKHPRPVTPSRGTVRKVFGSWNAALAAAGLPTGTRQATTSLVVGLTMLALALHPSSYLLVGGAVVACVGACIIMAGAVWP